MGHYVAVIILLGVLVSGAFLGIAMEGDSRYSERLVQEYDFSLLARDVAQTGLNATVRELAESYQMTSWNPGSGFGFENVPFDGGRFTTTVTANDPITGGTSGDTVDVIARGSMGPAEHVIFARYARDKDDVGIPPAFKYAIVSDQLMKLSGSMYIGSTNDTLNSSIHTNGNLTNQGKKFFVEGYGTYTGSTDIKDQHGERFDPNIDYNGPAPNYHEADSVHIPGLDWERLRAVAGDPEYAGGDQSRAGSYVQMGGTTTFTVDNEVIDFTNPNAAFWDRPEVTYYCEAAACGTADHPYVLFVDGTAEFKNTVKVIGNGYVVASGTITVSPQGGDDVGNAGGVYGQLNDQTESTVILGTQANMDVTANACFGLGPRSGGDSENMHCHNADDGSELTDYEAGITLYVEDGISFHGTPYIVGGVQAKNSTFEDTGNAIIRYASPNEGTLDLGFEYIIPIGPILIAYSEF